MPETADGADLPAEPGLTLHRGRDHSAVLLDNEAIQVASARAAANDLSDHKGASEPAVDLHRNVVPGEGHPGQGQLLQDERPEDDPPRARPIQPRADRAVPAFLIVATSRP